MYTAVPRRLHANYPTLLSHRVPLRHAQTVSFCACAPACRPPTVAVLLGGRVPTPQCDFTGHTPSLWPLIQLISTQRQYVTLPYQFLTESSTLKQIENNNTTHKSCGNTTLIRQYLYNELHYISDPNTTLFTHPKNKVWVLWGQRNAITFFLNKPCI